MVKGYVIKAENGRILTHANSWKREGELGQPYVHSLWNVIKILSISKNWKVKPVSVYEATYNKQEGTKIISGPYNITVFALYRVVQAISIIGLLLSLIAIALELATLQLASGNTLYAITIIIAAFGGFALALSITGFALSAYLATTSLQ